MRRVAVAGLHQPVVVPGGEEHHLLRRGGLDHPAGVGADAGAAGQDAEVERFEVREGVVGTGDEHDRLPRLHLVAVEEGVHLELGPLDRAELQDRDGLVHPAEEGLLLAEHLHRDAGTVVVGDQDFAGPHEVLIGVIARAHLLDREVEDVRVEPGAEPLFRRYCGSEEFINGGMRWCLWLHGVDPAVLRGLPRVCARVEQVRAFRRASTAAPTRAAAERAAEFFYVSQPSGEYIAVPEVSSERRGYIPIGYLPANVVASNKLYVVAAPDMFLFGVLSSAMHMAWVRVVCGRLRSDYQYSATMVYNTFPWPVGAAGAERGAVEAAAREVLDIRGRWPKSTLAELYDPLKMPASLARAHRALDLAVDRCYQREAFVSDQARFEHALGRYQATLLRVRQDINES